MDSLINSITDANAGYVRLLGIIVNSFIIWAEYNWIAVNEKCFHYLRWKYDSECCFSICR